ncbi:MAG: ThuA domain-containing protein [Verrucomicrobia bacterium]|nr:ThuA domain-containing protein [Verrucomicrobiota bacterium]
MQSLLPSARQARCGGNPPRKILIRAKLCRILLAVLLFPPLAWTTSLRGESIALRARSRVRSEADTNVFQFLEKPVRWEASRTAVVICDMWDKHHCPDATERVGEMAPRMNEVLKAARAKGMLIIHCPSDTMGYYKDHPGRKLAQAAPKVETVVPLQGWCSLTGVKEAALPIDDSDGGCDGCPECPGYGAWKRQHPALEILEGDAITDSAEAFYLMRQRGITNVIVMGVHINMCVLGRPFAIRQMVAQGQNVLLMRDLTDSMYNHRKPPYVSHFRGTELVVEHIEQYWCPSVTSADFLGGEPFRFQGDVKKRIVMVIGENEYHTWETLPEFARSELEWRGYSVSYVLSSPKDGDPDFNGYEAIRDADLLVLSARRRTPPRKMMELLRAHLAAGKPLVGLRTASHAFDAKPSDADYLSWSSFDVDVLGGHYEGHYGNKPPAAPPTIVNIVRSNASHLVLTGVKSDALRVTSHLYKNTRLAPTTLPLLEGRVEGKDAVEPVAWVNTQEDRRVFYTSLGNPDDFKQAAFRRLLMNGILWCLHDPVPPPQAQPVAESLDYSRGWSPLRVPGAWEDNSEGRLARYDGFAWYRCRVDLPPEWRGKELRLRVSDVDNSHEAYVNGTKVGSAGGLPPNYVNGLSEKGDYALAPALTANERGLWIAFRVFDNEGRGGFKAEAPSVRLGNEFIPLAGNWDFRTGDAIAWASYDESRAGTTPVFRATHAAASVPVPAPRSNPAAPDLPQETRAPALSPSEAMKHFHVADDLEWDQVLAEPVVTQPVFLNFDERGRMWVVEYRQYPSPAGLTMVSRDSVWRAVYDRVPPPPPRHFKGADRISIHEDTDGDGVYDSHKTFVDGLNIATAVERGRGGVWVLNPPYLLFYPDANNDDVPDGDPEVRLSGFGLEDTHSVANSLRWGPDGWLYAAQGSTVTANIQVYGADGKAKNAKPIYSQGQSIWRYHPEKRIYEVFSEGGGNAFGCEIDSQGRIFSGHNGGDTRGFHYAQGAYLQKGFEKHGPLSNPYAFGYFPAMPLGSVPRFTHNFLIYDHGALPARHAGKLFGVEPIQGRIVESEILPDQSSFRTRDLGRPVISDDRWFRPVDIKAGPDGAIYVCDWYDQQVNHFRNHEGKIDTSNGRIYRLRSKGAAPRPSVDLSRLSTPALMERLSEPNRWTRQTVLRLLADRRDSSLLPALSSALHRGSGQIALESLWALNLCGGLSEAETLRALEHADPQVRLWTVRLIGDALQAPPALAARLASMSSRETSLEVRNQLAATAKRLPAKEGLALVNGLARRSEDATDNRMPLMLWWAIEAKCDQERDEVIRLFADASFWRSPLVENHLIDRVARRFAQAGSRRDMLTCAQLFDLSPSPDHSRRLASGFEAAFKGRTLAGLPAELVKAMSRHGMASAAFALRQGDPRAVRKAIEVIADETAPRGERLDFLGVMSEVKVPGSLPSLKRAYLGVSKDDALRKAILSAFQSHDDPAVAEIILSVYHALGPESLPTAQTLLASRPAWAMKLAESIDPKGVSWSGVGIKPETIPLNIVRKLKQHRNPELQARLEKLWPNTGSPTTADMEKKIQRLAAIARAGVGNPYQGRTLFQNTCGGCHKLFGQGAEVGPDLTAYNRADLESILLAIVNPSAEIREGFENYSVETKDGRSLSGFLVEQDDRGVVMRGLDNQNVTLARADLLELKPAGISLMPEGLLDAFTEQQTRDLLGYLRSTQPLVGEAPKLSAQTRGRE